MTLTELIQKTYLKATGKPTAPSSGTRKYEQILELQKYYTEVWEREPGVDWSSLFDYRTLAVSVTATDTFALPATVRKVSQQDGDYVRIVLGNDEWEYELIPVDRLYEYRYENAVAQVGQSLMFSRAFEATDPQIGGSIVVPSYGYVDVALVAADTIAIDDPNWLVTICAAEFVRNDIVRQNQYPNLVAEATVLMERMKEDTGNAVTEVVKLWVPPGNDWS